MNPAIQQTATASNIDPDDIDVTSRRLGIRGLVIQLTMFFLVSRDLIVSTAVLHFFTPFTATVQFRLIITALLLTVVLSCGLSLRLKLVAVSPWTRLIFGLHATFLLVEGLLLYMLGGPPKAFLIVLVDQTIVFSSVSIAYFYATQMLDRHKVLRFLLQPYCYFSIFAAATGVAAWAFIQFGIVEPSAWFLPEGMMKKDVEITTGHYYTMPYFLSLVLYHQRDVFLGFEFTRASGLFYEPHIASLFLAPSLFLLPVVIERRTKKWKLRSAYLVIIVFLFVAYSITTLVVLAAISVPFFWRVLIPKLGIRRLWLSFAAVLIFGAVLWWVGASSVTINAKLTGRLDVIYAVTLSPLLEGSIFGGGLLYSVQGASLSALSAFVRYVVAAFILALAVGMFVSKRSEWYVSGALLYVVGHSFKSAGLVLFSGFYLYMVIIFALLPGTYWRSDLRE